MLQRQAVKKLHGDKSMTLILANLINRADIRMIQRRSRLCLALKTRSGQRILRHFVRQKLQRNKAAQAGIFSLVNHAHTAAAQFLDNAVVRDGLIDHGKMKCYVEIFARVNEGNVEKVGSIVAEVVPFSPQAPTVGGSDQR